VLFGGKGKEKKSLEKSIIEEFSKYLPLPDLQQVRLDDQLKLDLYPMMEADVIRSTDYMDISWKTDNIEIPISEGILTIGSERTYLSKGLIYLKGNLGLDVEYVAPKSRKLSRWQEASIVAKGLRLEDRKKELTTASTSPLYAMSTDRLFRMVVETHSNKITTSYRRDGREVGRETKEMWPYIIEKFLENGRIPFQEIRTGKRSRRNITITPEEINALVILGKVKSNKPSITVLTTEKPDVFENFSIVNPSGKKPVRVSGDARINFIPGVQGEGKPLDKILENVTLDLYPEKDFVFTSIPIPATIRPGPGTEVFTNKETSRIEFYQSNPFMGRETAEVHKTPVEKMSTYQGPIFFIEVNDTNKYEININTTVDYGKSGYNSEIGKQLFLYPFRCLYTTLKYDWPLDLVLAGCGLLLLTGQTNIVDLSSAFFKTLFNPMNIYPVKDPTLSVAVSWNLLALGGAAISSIGKAGEEIGFSRSHIIEHEKKEIVHEGDGAMKLKVGYLEHFTDQKPIIERMRKSKEDQEDDTKDWTKDKWLKKS